MLNPQTDNVTQAVQEATREGVEQADRIVKISTDVSERAARAGTEILQRNAETVQEALQSSAEIAARLTEKSADQFSRVFGISGEEAHKAAQKSSDNIDAIIHSSSVLTEVSQSISREWVNFTRERMEQNLNRFDSLMRCRTPQDFAAVQSEFLRDNLESFLQCARRIAEKSIQMADEATKRTAEAVESARVA
ncbi:MAG: phasin family protein [Rhodoplanes sp.]